MKKIKKRKPAFAKSTAGKVKKIKKAVKKNKAKKIIKKKNKPVKKANKRKTRKIVKRIKALKKTQKAKKSKKVTKIKKIKRIKKAKKARKAKSVRKIVKKRKVKKVVKKRKIKRRKSAFALARKRKSAFALRAMADKQDNVHKPRIMIIGVGGGGCSIINEIAGKLKKVSFVVANTDTQALQKSNRSVKRFQFGKDLTHGLGCGMNPNLGRICAKNEKEKIIKLFENIDLCILVSCLGGGTGSGATPIFAEILRELKKTSLGVFCLPFKFEGEKKSQIAKNSLEKMTLDLNAQIVLFNEKIFKIIDRKTPIKDAFSSINKKLIENLEGLIEMIYLPGLINIDFADLKMILRDDGKIAYLNTVKAAGPNRAEQAAKKSLKNPLNEYNIETTDSSEVSVSLNGSSNTSGSRLIPERILFNITASQDLKMLEVEQISKIISSYNKQARIVFGVSYDKKYKDKLRITLLATGKKEASPVKKLKKLLSSQVPQIKDIPQEEPKEQVEKKEVEKKIEIVKPKQIKKLAVKLPMKLPIKPVAKIPTKLPVKPPVKTPVKPIVQTNTNSRLRKNALDIKKEIEHIEEKMLLEEKKWDTPAFLRRKEQHE